MVVSCTMMMSESYYVTLLYRMTFLEFVSKTRTVSTIKTKRIQTVGSFLAIHLVLLSGRVNPWVLTCCLFMTFPQVKVTLFHNHQMLAAFLPPWQMFPWLHAAIGPIFFLLSMFYTSSAIRCNAFYQRKHVNTHKPCFCRLWDYWV